MRKRSLNGQEGAKHNVAASACRHQATQPSTLLGRDRQLESQGSIMVPYLKGDASTGDWRSNKQLGERGLTRTNAILSVILPS